jgi:hypothetical protein
MDSEKLKQKQRRNRALGAALVLVTILAVTFGFRRPWARPVPGVRIEPTRPIMEARDFGMNSGFALLVDAATEPKGLKPPAGGPHIWASSWEDGVLKLEQYPWPAEPPPSSPEDAKLKKDGPWTLAQYQEIERLGALYKPKVALLDRALADPDLRVPSVISSYARIDWLPGIRRLVKWLAIDAQRRAAQGDFPTAVQHIERILKLSNAICRGGAGLSFGNAKSHVYTAARATWQITTRHDLSEADLVALSQAFMECEDRSEPLAESFRNDVIAAKETAEEAYRTRSLRLVNGYGPSAGSSRAQKALSSLSFVVGRLAGSSYPSTARNLDNCYRQLITFTERPYSAAVDAEIQDFLLRLRPANGYMGFLFGTRDPIGLMCALLYSSDADMRLRSDALRRAALRGMATFCAIKAYEIKHDRLPDTLGDLVPDYLSSVPEDAFDGRPMRYLRDHVPGMPPGVWAVYSVSQGFKDEGGTAYSVGELWNKRVRNLDLVWPSRDYANPGSVK